MAFSQVVFGASTLGGTNVTLNVPGVSWAQDDVILVFFAIRDDNTTNGGCTNANLTFAGRVHRQDVQGVNSIHAWTAKAASAQTGQTIVLTTTGVSVGGMIAQVIVITGGNDYDSSDSADTGAVDTATPAVTLGGPVAANCRVYGGFTHRNRVFTTGTGTTLQINDTADSGGNVVSISSTYLDVATAGSNPTLDGTLNLALDWAAAAVAISPAAAPPTGGRPLDAKWYDFSSRGKRWTHFWQDNFTLIEHADAWAGANGFSSNQLTVATPDSPDIIDGLLVCAVIWDQTTNAPTSVYVDLGTQLFLHPAGPPEFSSSAGIQVFWRYFGTGALRLAGGAPINIDFPVSTPTIAASFVHVRYAGALDRVAHANGSGTAPNSGLTASTAALNEYLFEVIGYELGSTFTSWSNGETPIDTEAPSDARADTGYRLVTSIAQYRSSATITTGPWTAYIATFLRGGAFDVDAVVKKTISSSFTADAVIISSGTLFNRTLSDTLTTLTDSVTRVANKSRTASDTITSLSDSLTRAAAVNSRSASDTLTISDSLVRAAIVFARTASDTTTTLTDSVTRVANKSRTASDTLTTLTDSVARIVVFNRTASDTLTLSDSLVRAAISNRTATDTLTTPTDSISRVANKSRTASDTITLSDALTRLLVLPRTLSDTPGTLSDSLVRAAIFYTRTLADSPGVISDSLTRAAILHARTFTDTIATLTDSVSRTLTNGRTLSDTLTTLSDSLVRAAAVFNRTESDTITSVNDSITRLDSEFRLLADTIATLTDSIARITGKSRTLTDSTTISDSLIRAAALFTRTLSDSPGVLSDSVTRVADKTRTLADTIALSESLTRSAITFNRTLTDTITISDSLTRTAIHPRTFSDTITTLTDSISRSLILTRTLGVPFRDQITGFSPISYWRWGESSGTAAADEQGANAATYVGAPTLGVPGSLVGDANTAVRLNGSSQYMSAPDSATLDFGDSVSVAIRFKRNRINVDEALISKGPGSLMVVFNADNSVALVRQAVVVISTSAPGIATDMSNWHSLVIVKVGSDVRLVLDNVNITGSVSNSTLVNTADPFLVGQRSNGLDLFLGADVDETAIWNRALTANEIATYTAGSSGDSIVLTDSLTRAAILHDRTATDTTTISDSLVRAAISHARTLTDSPGVISDSLVRAAITHSRTASDTLTLSDSLVRAAGLFTRSLTDTLPTLTDSVVVVGKSLIVNAVIKKTISGTFSTDAIVNRTTSATFTASAVIRASQTAGFTADAVIRKTGQASFTANAVIRQTRTAGFSADAVLLTPRTASFTADALIRFGFSFTADAQIKSLTQGAFTIDASISGVHVGTISGTTTAATIAASSTVGTIAGSSTAGTVAATTTAGTISFNAGVRVTSAFTANARIV